MSKKIRIKQVRSIIKQKKNVKLNIKALGLKMGREKIYDANPEIMGKIKKVAHLLEIEEVE